MAGKGRVTYCFGHQARWSLLHHDNSLFGPISTCDPLMAQLIGGQRGGGLVWEWHQILWFWWVSWPQSSLIIHQRPRTKIIWRRLCFYHNMWHWDNNKTQRQPQLHCAMRSWMGHAYLSSSEWRNLRSSLGFVYHPIPLSHPPPPGEFFPRIPAAVFGGFKG